MNDIDAVMVSICDNLKELGFNATISEPGNAPIYHSKKKISINDRKNRDDFCSTHMLSIYMQSSSVGLYNKYDGAYHHYGDFEYADPAFPKDLYDKIEDLSGSYNLRGER